MAENEIDAPVLGISWDGTGLGTDNTIWGGEFLLINDKSFERFAHLRQFRLPGGEKAVVEPRRAALGILFEIYGEDLSGVCDLPTIKALEKEELSVVTKMLEQKLNAPVTSSAGRLFDAVSSIIGLRQVMRYEGQAAMELEYIIGDIKIDESYPIEIIDNEGVYIINWEQLVRHIIEEYRNSLASGLISAKFHNSMAEIMVEIARKAGQEKVVLSGGCFQNKYLLEQCVERLDKAGFRPYWHQRIPPNDGGISLGQVMAAIRSK